MKRIAFAVATAALLAGTAGLAATAGPAAKVSTQQARLGAPFTVEVEVPMSGKEVWRAQPLPADSPFSLLGQRQVPGQGIATLQIQLGVFALGPQALPPLKLRSSTGQERVVSGAGQVTGTTALAKGDTQLRPLAGPVVPLVFAWRFALTAGVLMLLGATLLVFAVRQVVRWGLSAERRERKALQKLIASACDDREFYVALDGMVRRYLERRHGIPAPKRTSSELCGAVAAQPTLPAAELGELFREADLVKFAERPARPGRRDADSSLVLRLLTHPAASPRGNHVSPAPS